MATAAFLTGAVLSGCSSQHPWTEPTPGPGHYEVVCFETTDGDGYKCVWQDFAGYGR